MERIHVTRAERLARAGAATRREPAAAVLALQRMAGNRAVGHLLRCKDKKDKPKRKSPAQLQAEQMAQKAAPNQTQIAFAHLPADAQHALREILAGRAGPYLRPSDGKHSTDPETGLAKRPGIGVREYHTVPYNESYRLVVRTKGQDKSAYWDSKHTAGTYTYHRITGVPWPAAAPPPAPASRRPHRRRPPPPPRRPRPSRCRPARCRLQWTTGRASRTAAGGGFVSCPRVILRVKRFIARVIRGVLLRVVRRPAREAGGDRRLIIVLWTAWNMGGTIRAAFNLAEYMQARGWRRRDHQRLPRPRRAVLRLVPRRRARARPRRPAQGRRPLRKLLRKLPSVAHALRGPRRARASACGPTSSSSAGCTAAPGSSSARARA